MRETHRFNPWHRLHALGSTWRLQWSGCLPDDCYGLTDWPSRTITLRDDMSFEERRSTICHEVQHVVRGPASNCQRMEEEIAVSRIAARLLLPSLVDVADALTFHRGCHDSAAEDLWVDPWTLEVRLSALYPLERKYLQRRLDDAILLTIDESPFDAPDPA